MTRSHVLVVVGGGLLLLGVAELLGGGCGCTVHVPGSWSVTSKDGVELPHEAKLHVSSPAKPSRIVLDLETAAVVVQGDESVTGLEADYEVREKTPGDASLVASQDGVEVKSAGGNPVLVTSAKLRVPPGTAVDVSTSLGTVTVSGIHGAASVAAKSDGGRVALSDLADVPKVTVETSLGEVTLTKGAGLGTVTLATDSGSVSAHDVSGAKSVSLRSGVGGVKASSVTVSESLKMETDTGAVDVADAHAARALLRSDVGAVTARHSEFDHVSAHSDVGAIHFVGCKYKTKDLGTDVGSVKEE
jgi:hypothetical protein